MLFLQPIWNALFAPAYIPLRSSLFVCPILHLCACVRSRFLSQTPTLRIKYSMELETWLNEMSLWMAEKCYSTAIKWAIVFSRHDDPYEFECASLSFPSIYILSRYLLLFQPNHYKCEEAGLPTKHTIMKRRRVYSWLTRIEHIKMGMLVHIRRAHIKTKWVY